VSHQDLQTVKGAYDAFARQDIPGVLAALDPDVDWEVPATVPWGGPRRGHDEVVQFFASLPEFVEEIFVEPEQLLDAGDHIVVLGRHHGRGRDGDAYDVRFAMVWEMRDGKAVSFREHTDTATLAATVPHRSAV